MGAYGGWAVHEAVRQGWKGEPPDCICPVAVITRRMAVISACTVIIRRRGADNRCRRGQSNLPHRRNDGYHGHEGILEGNGYVPVTTCTFRHLLTQVRLVCYSDRADAWGTIQTIEAADVHTRQELDLSAETPRLADISVAEDIRNLPVQDIAGLLIRRSRPTDRFPRRKGFLLLPASPVDGMAAHPLHLRITTTKDGNGNLKETLSNVFVRIEGGFEIGKTISSHSFHRSSQHTKPRMSVWKRGWRMNKGRCQYDKIRMIKQEIKLLKRDENENDRDKVKVC